MAYIPPHKRHLKDTERPLPIPESFPSQFGKKLNLSSSKSKSNVGRSGKFVYADQAIYRWFPVGLNDDDMFPSSVNLEPVSMEFIERKTGRKPLVLINSHIAEENEQVEGNCFSRKPWVSVVENVMPDLLSSFEYVRNEILCDKLEDVKPHLVARFGKILFHGSPSISQGTTGKGLSLETALRQSNSSFYTNVPTSYVENIMGKVAQKIEVVFEEEKDLYHVQLSDATQPGATISCKCSVIKENKKLQLYKIQLNQVRHLVVDISCLDNNLDLRLMLCTKKILTALTDDEMQSIRDLINSAVLDPDVKGGLRWPLGNASSGDRYCVVGVWHTVSKVCKSPVRLKVRHADRFDFRTSTGQTTREIRLKLNSIVSELQEQKFDIVPEMLKDNLKLIWDHFLCCERFFT